MTETKEQRHERLVKALAGMYGHDWDELDEADKAGFGFEFDGIINTIIASDEAAGLVVVPVEPTTEMVLRACASLGTVFPPGPSDARRYYRAMIAAAKEQS